MKRPAPGASRACWSSCGLQAGRWENQYVDTVVHADGSVDRAIVQSTDVTPEAAQRPAVWRETRMAKAGPEDPWDGALAALPAAANKEEQKLFAAAGHFPTVAAIPDHYAEMAKDGVAASRLVRTYTTRDLGLVTEHVWTETLTDIASLGRDGEGARGTGADQHEAAAGRARRRPGSRLRIRGYVAGSAKPKVTFRSGSPRRRSK